MKFRKKPVVIEAFQMTEARRASNADWPLWLHVAWNLPLSAPGAVSCVDFPNSNGTDRLVIRTLEGLMTVEWGDWIIQGVNGELYPCKPDIFAKTYEAIADGNAGSQTDYTPKMAGLYFARRYKGDDWYFYVVWVGGMAPFLRAVQGIDLRSDRPIPSSDLSLFEWGPKIERPEIPVEEIQKLRVY